MRTDRRAVECFEDINPPLGSPAHRGGTAWAGPWPSPGPVSPVHDRVDVHQGDDPGVPAGLVQQPVWETSALGSRKSAARETENVTRSKVAALTGGPPSRPAPPGRPGTSPGAQA